MNSAPIYTSARLGCHVSMLLTDHQVVYLGGRFALAIGRAGELRHRIKNIRKILIILDDVWQRLDLDNVGIPYRNEHPRCTILLTSRSEEVACTQMRSQRTFIVQILAEDEAWNLFGEVTGTSIDTPDVRPIAKQVAKEYGGLPVALVTVGRALENRSKEEWKDALHQLRKSIAEIIGNECKCVFKFGKGLRLFQGTETMEKARSNAEYLVHTLKRCFLLLDSNKEDCVKMHDIVCDVATSIASKEHGFVVRCDNEIEEWPEINRREDCTAFSLVTSRLHLEVICLRIFYALEGYQKNFNELHEVGFSMLKIFKLNECRGVKYLMDLNSKWTDDQVQKSSSESTPTFIPVKCIKWLPNLEKLEITSCPTIRVVVDFHGLVMPLLEKEKGNSKQAAVHKQEEDQRHWCLRCIPARKDKIVQGNNATTSSHSDAQREARSTGRDDGLVRESPYPYGDYNMNGTDKELVFHNSNILEVFVCNSVVAIFDSGESQELFPLVFNNLSEMRLGYLPKLTHICGQPNCAFRLPSLEKILIKGCYKLEKFVPAAAATSVEDTPKLKQVEDRDLPPPQRNNCLGNLNTTIQHNFQLKQVRQKENPKKKEVLSVHKEKEDQLRYLIFCEGSIKAPEQEPEKLKDKRAEIQLAMEAATRSHRSSSYKVGVKGRKAKKNTLVILKLQQGKVEKILYTAPPTEMHLESSMKAFDSRTEILKQVMEAPMDENVHIIAICRMGGIGKTTMEKQVARRVKRRETI
ncbi:hypothetical protein FNV43_RR24377 [Rhamnella rubrinervis]|uniref:NB-ARC domain-containing protein n=1 Tax=Rhamnella rubrinervis TaxID=2594499 RepID=A0A8K0DSY0_9ROSA|nr:hypothetical protein FNV43_RR24377 [Rhamnella rubrinervis]